MTTETAEVLRKARALVEEGWTQGAMSRDARGYKSLTSTAAPVCFCAIGAIQEADPKSCLAAATALGRIVGGSIIDFNDAPGRTQQEVIAAFDRAIAAEESK